MVFDNLQDTKKKSTGVGKYISTIQSSNKEHAVYNLAAGVIREAFEHFPSPTGKYGQIAVGRE